MDEKIKPASKRGPIRIHRLARELGVASRDVIRLCLEACGARVKNHMSSISQDNAETIRQAVVPPPETETETEARTGDQTAAKPEVVTEAEPESEAPQDALADKPVEEKRRRRRGGRRRGGRGRGRKAAAGVETQAEGRAPGQSQDQPQAEATDTAPVATDERERNAGQDGERPTGPKKRSRRRRRSTAAQAADTPVQAKDTSPAQKPAANAAPATAAVTNGNSTDHTIPRPKRRTGLYGRGRRAISPSTAIQNAANNDR